MASMSSNRVRKTWMNPSSTKNIARSSKYKKKQDKLKTLCQVRLINTIFCF